jgi:hypothetical protein
MKALVMVMALLVGIALALLTQGRMAHLRLVAGDLLPGWSAAIAADASVLSGRAQLAPLDLSWRAVWPDGSGPVWRLQLTGPGTRLDATLHAGWTGREARIDAASGQIDLAALPLPVDGITGLVNVVTIEATIARRNSAAPRIDATAGGTWLGAGVRGTALGSGPVIAQFDPAASWRISAELYGPLGSASLRLSGRLGLPHIGLAVRVTDGPDLPEDWRKALQFGGTLSDGVWSLQQKLPLGG